MRVNRNIFAHTVRVTGEDGSPLGIMPLVQAQTLAWDQDLDLVEVAPQAKPPVCKIMDYGKFKYQEAKRQHEAKLKQKQVVVKEVKFRPGTDEGDYKIKIRNLLRFLEEGDKVKVTLRFRGRELAHQVHALHDHLVICLSTTLVGRHPQRRLALRVRQRITQPADRAPGPDVHLNASLRSS